MAEMNRVSYNETALAGRDTTRAVDRACAVLTTFSHAEPRLGLSEIAARLGLPKATVYRLVSSLVASGFMTQAADGRYELGFKLFELGSIVQRNLDLVRACEEAMAALAEETEETILLARAEWDSGEVVVVAKHDSPHPLSILSPVGRRSPLPPGCLGKALLAGMDPADADAFVAGLRLEQLTPRTLTDPQALLADIRKARADGFALEEQEYRLGVSGVAAPVIFDGHRPVGALGVVGPSSRLRRTHLRRIGARIRELTRSLWRQEAAAGLGGG